MRSPLSLPLPTSTSQEIFVPRRLLFLAAVLVLIPSFVARGEETPGGVSVNGLGQIERELSSLSEVQYFDTQLAEVVNDLGLRHKINMELDKPALEAKGLSAKLPITAALKAMSLESILNTMLPPEGLTWAIQNQTLLITTLEAEPKYTIMKVYRVDDFTTDLDSLRTLIQASVAPKSWRTIGKVVTHPESESLIVLNTARNQRQIAKLLHALRSSKTPTAK